MKLTHVLTATNEKKLYIQFIPLIIKTWKKVVKLTPKIVLVANKIPKQYEQYKDHIILFPPVKNIPTSFQAQCIRLIYPALLDTKYFDEKTNTEKDGAVIITDMDMIPMNRRYYTKTVKNINQNTFAIYRNFLSDRKEYPMCYCAGTPKTWGEIFGVKTLEDIRPLLKLWHKQRGGWASDQKILFQKSNKWNKKTKRLKRFRDLKGGGERLGRNHAILNRYPLNPVVVKKIRNRKYFDFHMLRPYNNPKNKKIINAVLKHLYNPNPKLMK